MGQLPEMFQWTVFLKCESVQECLGSGSIYMQLVSRGQIPLHSRFNVAIFYPHPNVFQCKDALKFLQGDIKCRRKLVERRKFCWAKKIFN
jgi:hypothetical protein